MIILVTGATRGSGLALFRAASAAGHQVVLNHRTASSRADAEALLFNNRTDTVGELGSVWAGFGVG